MGNQLVFIHGSGDSSRIWRLQLAYFSSQGWQALAIDLPGHGQRPDSFPAEVSVQDYANAVHEIVKQELHLTRPIIAGHSLGGAIALTMGLEYGSDLAGLILIGTGARLKVHPDLLESARQQPQQARQDLTELALTQQHISAVSSEVSKEVDPPGPTILYRDLAACNRFDVMNRLHELTLPTLIICGVEDRLTPPKYSQYLHQHIANSTLCIIPSAGHYVMREEPTAVNQTIADWLSTSGVTP
jgi:pimeloyl-ACP methyl ester carboxylesterase